APHDEDTWVIVLRPDREPQAGHDQMCLCATLCRWCGARRRSRYSAGSRCQRAYIRHCIPYLLLGKPVPKSCHGGTALTDHGEELLVRPRAHIGLVCEVAW